MRIVRELKRRSRHVLLPVLYLCALAYVGYHAIEGDRGIKVWSAVNQKIDAERLKHQRLAAERDRLEHRVSLLRERTLDADMLDEAVRRMLNLGRPGEIVIYYKQQIGETPLHQ